MSERPASSRLIDIHSISLFSSERGDQIEGVADDVITMLDAGTLQGFANDIGDQLAHDIQP
jgi:hypothetical protein